MPAPLLADHKQQPPPFRRVGEVERGSAPFVRIADKDHRSRIVPVAVPLHRASFFVAVDYTTSLFVCFAMAFITAFTNTGLRLANTL